MFTETPDMQALPRDVLSVIWNLLRKEKRPRDCTDQWALRCTCRALRQATAPLISSLRIIRQAPAGLTEPVDEDLQDVLTGCSQPLQCFPSDAVLRKLDVEGWHPNIDMLPSAALQCFACCGGTKLANVLSLTLSMVEVDVGAVSAFVLACPQLQELVLDTARLHGPILVPLARLPSLCSVSLRICRPFALGPSLAETVSSLTQLTNLEVMLPGNHDKPEDSWDALVPQITKLQQLCGLALTIKPGDLANVNCLEPLTALSRLSSLRFNTDYEPLPLSPNHNPFLALASLESLVSLDVRESDLTSALAHALSVLPHLTHLSGDGVDTDADLSPLAGSLRSLILHRCNGLEQLAALQPLTSLTRLEQDSGFMWGLESSDGAEQIAGILNPAVEVLNRAWRPRVEEMRSGPWCFTLMYFTSGPVQRNHLALQALAPLNKLRKDLLDHFVLPLYKEWDVSAAHAQQLHAHFPHLRQLRVSAEGPGFLTLAGALSSSLPNLRTLMIAFPLHERNLPPALIQALLAMAAARAGNGLSLRVKHYASQPQGNGSMSWRNLVASAEQQQRECKLPNLVQFCLKDGDLV